MPESLANKSQPVPLDPIHHLQPIAVHRGGRVHAEGCHQRFVVHLNVFPRAGTEAAGECSRATALVLSGDPVCHHASFQGVSAHVFLLYPFVAPAELDEQAHRPLSTVPAHDATASWAYRRSRSDVDAD